MKKNRAQKDILYLSISSFVLVVLWIGFNLYHNYVTTTIAPDLQLEIAPIEPSFNTEIINNLKARTRIEPLYEYKNNQASPTVSPDPATQETSKATNSGERRGQ